MRIVIRGRLIKMQNETRQCQNCKNNFVIEQEDFNFYEKIKVPPPTFCPECRVQRRMSFLNERTFYKRKCDLTGEPIISLFPENAEVPVYSPKAWWSDKWDATDYGQDYDFSKPFFEQFGKLLRRVPQFALQNQYTTLVNTEYVNMGTYLRNCYLVTNTAYSEDSGYTTVFLNGKRCYDIYGADQSELCYECIHLGKCYRTFYSMNCNDCLDVYFSKDLRRCNNCFGCSNLVGKSYCIWNKQYSKEAYFEELKKYNLGSYKTIQELKVKVEELDKVFPKRFMEGIQNVHVSGNYIYESRNVQKAFEVYGLEDSKYCQFVFYKPARDCYDMTLWGENATRIYECMGAGDSQDMIKFSFDCWAPATNIEYSYHVTTKNDNLFGCIGLKNRNYCILNKQYSKEEYEKMIPKIKKHMNEMPYIDKKGLVYKYGEFFPSEISLFAYNESFAHNYFPLIQEEAIAKGFRWKEKSKRNYKIDVVNKEIPDDIKDIDDKIIGKVIECEHKGKCNEKCTEAFKIILDELTFYKNMKLPLPRLCPNCRHYQRLKKQNPLKLWHRKCMKEGCTNEFETSYAPERLEIIYCERCYQQEVY